MARHKEANSMSFLGLVTSAKLLTQPCACLGDMKACKEGVTCNRNALRQT